MSSHSAVILGGGLAGLAAAYALAGGGWRNIVIVERGNAPGGLAGSFQRDGRWYPLGYHHILQKDKTLLAFLDRIGVRDRIRWRRIRMLFQLDGRLYDLGTSRGFAAFPMPWAAKLRFARAMLRAAAKSDWHEWEGRSAAELIDAWAGGDVRHRLFDPLCRLKFQLAAEDVSGAWLGARLHFREGASALGYIPGANWTKVLCDGLAELVRHAGVEIRLRTSVERLESRGPRMTTAVTDTGERLEGDVFVSTLPPPTYLRLVPADQSPVLASIRYTALLSMVCAARPVAVPPFYWLNLTSLQSTASALFRLDALNPTIGADGEMCFNFVTHLGSCDDPLFSAPEDEIVGRYVDDFERLFGVRLWPSWVHLARVPMYSPVFDRAFRNPPLRSSTWNNMYFAGNYRTFPSVASTGTAMASGVTAAVALHADRMRASARRKPPRRTAA